MPELSAFFLDFFNKKVGTHIITSTFTNRIQLGTGQHFLKMALFSSVDYDILRITIPMKHIVESKHNLIYNVFTI